MATLAVAAVVALGVAERLHSISLRAVQLQVAGVLYKIDRRIKLRFSQGPILVVSWCLAHGQVDFSSDNSELVLSQYNK